MKKVHPIDSTEFGKNLAKINKDIMAIKISHNDSFKTMMNKFYAVMRKWKICQGTWTENGGRICNNYEWTMCFEVFKSHKLLSYDIWLALTEPPKDLLAYGPKPKQKK